MSETRTRKPGTPGKFSRWMQVRAGARAVRKIRGGRARMMGMDMLVLNTVGKRSGQPRETALTWFPDGDDGWLIVASGGGSQNPDWYANMMARPERVSVEMPGREAVPVTPRRLDGGELDTAWQRIAEAQPRYAKYQSKSDRRYPVVRLTRR
ncbi:nitroreductase family deazaflavin-dependent oxidoreductase [Amycolatopsis suaedae]|uniref:Nitroreductase family deazaflavin-dependent oxidoreductase n=1 Tax=Amycolatopsis suaedae TaxID=2510978 RepID=A0A4Q7JC56_9PSEU|nr:nitroreductase family deazaflavin-dependent oxidoreductase [Amycolatopsis suaedae]RZQ64626.1 nitroreductase family deazaflavin-dependent oxidoreductase [Amycolatopsis suaedae]